MESNRKKKLTDINEQFPVIIPTYPHLLAKRVRLEGSLK